ncbi:ABC transporter substrate-binding protein [Aestuariibius sp. 2305UL40-4]|uniref:ABC transporter substrate-binding protein n=1 Tax=Aestuariibius violaceus TaxID=3234132 RepID=UPI00345EBCCE
MHASLPKLAAAAAALLLASSVAAEQGVTDDSVTFAQVAALEGPAAGLGLGMKAGLEAAFAEANRNGGIHGRQIYLESFDDGYEPDKSIAQITQVIESDKYIGLIGPVGTPTTLVTQPIATEAEFPFIGPFTGAGFLRDASHGNIFNVRATYAAETEAWMQYLVDSLGMTNIAMLYQDDGFGYVGLDGVEKALDRRGMKLSAQGTYTRNTLEVTEALDTIEAANPEAVVMVGAYAPCAEFIKQAKARGMDPVFVNISFVGSNALSRELGEQGEGVIVSQVVPFPLNSSIPAIAEYQSSLLLSGMAAELGFVSLEGYLVGRLAVEALRNSGPKLTREKYLNSFNSLRSVDLGGIELVYDDGDNQGSDAVYLTRITDNGSFEAVVVDGKTNLGQ